MEKLIRSILNYSPESASNEDAEQMCATVAALSMFLLEKTKKFDIPNQLNIETVKDMFGGSFSQTLNLMHVSEDIFRGEYENFLNDITIMAHECCHFGQRYDIGGDSAKSNGHMLVYDTNHFKLLMYYLIKVEAPQLVDIIRDFGFETIVQFDENIRLMYDYFYSYYSLQSFEMEAEDFSVKVYKYIDDTAKKLQLNSKEKRNLDQMKILEPAIERLYKKREYLASLRQDKDFSSMMRVRVDTLVDLLLEQNPDYLKKLDQSSGLEIEEDSLFDVITKIFCLALEISYNDKLARKIFTALCNAKQNNCRDFLLFNIALLTKIGLSEEDIKRLKEILLTTNLDIKGIDFDLLLLDKQRVMAERKAIDEGSYKNKYEFSFE